ncbi:hypothetical protein XENTR_v10011091 [Xenopus tropicalis]|uniref:Phospholipase A and acyltransferase 3 n=1 Tax=Xenopus tropicalis TaxID=8364 RepID=A0A6I8RYC6_XENTR|nr:phospholipase A and acyltransferase 3 [Xenopus tropicalis]XP_012817824.1 phospholipase A and acyltransferase 3 [Xenopus tropicalis]XP_012817825.1 phospholipase A and acyltransferase 3 [Xenopus tropicalis]XP_017948884.1 phospholipase A and acyltransferase 3 [Xenopus tropicalis]KAE8607239.1 hypothetical protein XENTR_v10011091 [Xenopus tropicalis]|eukprot:XP_012817824.1 PREDICTED: HRAS-like suppressor 3 [Xenopus tropicalis]
MPLVGVAPVEGDLIEFHRPLYQHWGIYVGKGCVVHLTDQQGFSYLSSAFGGTAEVKMEPLEAVAAGCNYQVNNKYDKKRSPLPPTKVVRAAIDQVGQTKQYSVTSANCEHFVTELRYEKAYCDQVDNAITYATVGGGVVAALGVIAAFSSMRNKQKQ